MKSALSLPRSAVPPASAKASEPRTRPNWGKRLRALPRTHPEYVYAPLLFVVAMLVWEWLVYALNIPPYLIPTPARIAVSLFSGLSKPLTSAGGFYLHMGYTVWEAILGFFIGSALGVVLGGVVAQSRTMERTLMPYLAAFQATPKIAVAPLFVVWLGFGITSKVLMVVLLTFFPLLINSLAGFKSVPKNRIDLARSLCASDWDIFRYIKFPSALPFIFAGLEMAAVFSITGAIVGEFVGADAGMGLFIMQARSQMDVPGVFAALVLLAVIGIVFHLAMDFCRRRVVFWEAGNDHGHGKD